MKDLEIMDERIIKVADLLEQIKSVDEMIGLLASIDKKAMRRILC